MSTAINKKLGQYKCLIIGGFGHFSFVFASTFPAYKYDHQDNTAFFTSTFFMCTLLILSAIINGLGAAIIWVAEGSYVASCAVHKTKGFFYGFFWIVYMSSQVVGSLMGALILSNNKSQTVFYLLMSGLALLASLAFGLTRKPLVLETESQDRVVLQASHLSNVNDYFNTTATMTIDDPCSYSYRDQDSFRVTLLK